MKKFVVFISILSLICGINVMAFASSDMDQDQQQGQIGINKQGQAQGQIGINKNENNNQDKNANLQGQFQKNIGAVDQGNAQDTNIGGDTVKTYVLNATDTIAQSGQSAVGGYSIFGGLNLVETEEVTNCMKRIQIISQMQAAGLMSEAEGQKEALEAFYQLKDASQPRRVLGILWKTRGRHLGNVFGLLSLDSFVGEYNKPAVKEKTIDEGVTGNGGNVNN